MASLMDSVMQVVSSQTLTASGTSAKTADAFDGSGPYCIIELSPVNDIYWTEGTDPTATSSNSFLKGGDTRCYKINRGNKIAVLQVSSGGTVYINQLG